MMPYDQGSDKRSRNLKLALYCISLSMLFFVSGTVLNTLKDAIIPFTSTHIPIPIFSVLSIFYFVFFIVASFILLIPTMTEVVDELLDWVASSILWCVLAALIFFPIMALTFIGLIQSTLAFPTSIFSIPVMSIVVGWLIYVAIIIIIDLIEPDWREAVWDLFSGANRPMDYSQQMRESRAYRPRVESVSVPSVRQASESQVEEGNQGKFAEKESEEQPMARESYIEGGGGGRNINWAFLLTGVFALLVSGVFGYYYWQTTNTINQRNLTIATQNATIAQRDTTIASLQNDLTNEKANSTDLQTKLTGKISELNTANNNILMLNNQITSLQGNLTAETAKSASLSTQLTNSQSQVSSLQAQVDSLTAITNLSSTTVQASAGAVSQGNNTASTVASFSVSYAGYLQISGSSNAGTGYITVSDSSSYYPSAFNTARHSFGTGSTVYVPVLPGSVTVSFGNTESGAGPFTATITVTYYY